MKAAIFLLNPFNLLKYFCNYLLLKSKFSLKVQQLNMKNFLSYHDQIRVLDCWILMTLLCSIDILSSFVKHFSFIDQKS